MLKRITGIKRINGSRPAVRKKGRKIAKDKSFCHKFLIQLTRVEGRQIPKMLEKKPDSRLKQSFISQ